MNLVVRYNDHCPDPGTELPDVQVLQCLKAALAEVPQFKHISDREIENQVANNAPPYTLQQCLRIACHVAINLDDEHQKGKHQHSANHTTFGHASDDNSVDDEDFATKLSAYFTKNSPSVASRPRDA